MFTDDYVKFVDDRADRLASVAAELCETKVSESLWRGIKFTTVDVGRWMEIAGDNLTKK